MLWGWLLSHAQFFAECLAWHIIPSFMNRFGAPHGGTHMTAAGSPALPIGVLRHVELRCWARNTPAPGYWDRRLPACSLFLTCRYRHQTIDLRGGQQNPADDVKPEHQRHHSSQWSVPGCVMRDVLNVETKEPAGGKEDGGAEHG